MSDTRDPHQKSGTAPAGWDQTPPDPGADTTPPKGQPSPIADLPSITQLPDYIAWAKARRTTGQEPGL